MGSCKHKWYNSHKVIRSWPYELSSLNPTVVRNSSHWLCSMPVFKTDAMYFMNGFLFFPPKVIFYSEIIKAYATTLGTVLCEA